MSPLDNSAPELDTAPIEDEADVTLANPFAAEVDRCILAHLADKLRNVLEQRA